MNATATAIEAALGPIDVLIYNCSAGPFKPLLETTQEEFDRALATGPSGLFAFAKARPGRRR